MSNSFVTPCILVLISKQFIARHIKCEKQEYFIYFIFVKGIMYQGLIAVFNLKSPYNKILKMQKILQIGEKTDKSTVMLKHFSNSIYQKLTTASIRSRTQGCEYQLTRLSKHKVMKQNTYSLVVTSHSKAFGKTSKTGTSLVTTHGRQRQWAKPVARWGRLISVQGHPSSFCAWDLKTWVTGSMQE